MVRVVLPTFALMLRCVQTICVSVRARPRNMAMCFLYIIKRNFVAKTWTRSVDFILLFTIFVCLVSVIVGFGYFSVIRPFK